MTVTPTWLTDLLQPWVCPGCGLASHDCDSSVLVTEAVMAELKKRIVIWVEEGIHMDHDILWWLEQDDALEGRYDD